MSVKNIQYIKKEYQAGIHSFLTIGDGSSNTPLDTLVNETPFEVMVIKNGNVGIGTTVPRQKFEVYGDINFTGSLLNNGSNYGGGGSSQWTTAGNDIYYTTGSVGIGTNDPQSTLAIGTGLYDTTSTLMFNSGDADKLYWTFLKNGSKIGHSAGWNVNHYAGQAGVEASIGNGNFHFFTGANPNYNERLTILNNGAVGIGSTQPINNLDVFGAAYISNTLSVGTGVDIIASNEWAFTDYYVDNNAGYFGVGLNPSTPQDGSELCGYVWNYNNYGIQFGTNNTERMRLDNLGNLGIGTAIPNYKLQVEGNAYLNGEITTNNNNINAGTGTITATTFSGTATQVSSTLTRGTYLTGNNYNGASATTWAVDATTDATASKIVARDGFGNIYAANVGIGTATARAKLDIQDGNAIISGNVGIGSTIPVYSLDVNGTIQGTAMTGAMITDSTSTTSSTIAASATAVKSAYDLANNALPKTGGLISGNLTVSNTITTSNLTVIGDYVTLNTITSNTEQVIIDNAGTGPALKVSQSGYNSVAEFYDKESGIALIIADNGNIGIGTSTSSYRLHVEGASYLNGNVTTNNNNINAGTGTITATTFSGTATQVSSALTIGNYLTGDNYNGASATTWAVDATTAATASKIVARDASSYIYASGVGIGTAVARALLDIEGGEAIISGNIGIGTTITKARLHVLKTETTGDIVRIEDIASDTTPFIINNDGNVGIGTTISNGTLHLYKQSGTDPVSIILENRNESSSTEPVNFIKFRESTGATIYDSFGIACIFTNPGGSANKLLITATDQDINPKTADAKVTVLQSGNVGIGITSPVYKLQVEGTSYLNGTVTTNNNNINAGSGTITATTFSGTATQVSSTLTRGTYLTGSDYNGASATTWAVDATTAATASKIVARDASANIYTANIGISTSVALYPLHVVGASYLNGTVTTNNNNINAGSGTITATTFSGTATQVSSTLTIGNYLTGNNYNGASATTWAVDADSANTANKVVARDASGNFSAGTITATLSGTATQVSSTLTRGTYLTGSDYNGASATTWAVDATTAATASKIVARDGFGNIYAANVGIGTTTVREKLDIQGGNAIISGNVGIGTTIANNSLNVYGNVYIGKGLSGTVSTFNGGPFHKQAGWDTAGTSHTILSTEYGVGENSSGTIHIQAKSASADKLGNAIVSFLNANAANVDLFNISYHKTANLSTFTIAASTNDISITTDSDCSIAWTSIGSC